MYFDERIGMKERIHQDIIQRESVRCIAIRDNKVLLVTSNRGDCIFPGGGIKKDESHEDALIREILEETGYGCEKILGFAGKVFERKIDIYEPDKIFEMTSYYYLCELSDEKGEQRLEEYEAKLELKPVWLAAEEAIKMNKVFESGLEDGDIWGARPDFVLSKIESILKDND